MPEVRRKINVAKQTRASKFSSVGARASKSFGIGSRSSPAVAAAGALMAVMDDRGASGRAPGGSEVVLRLSLYSNIVLLVAIQFESA